MPGPIKGLMFFQSAAGSPRTVGWSESVYFPGISTLPGALARLQILAQARCMMLGAGVLNTFLRCSDDTIFRDSLDSIGVPPAGSVRGLPYYNPAYLGELADFSGSAYFVLCAGGDNTYRRIYWISGIPDIAQEIDFPSPQSAAFVNAFGAWSNLLTGGNYGFRVNDVLNLRVRVTNVAGSAVTTAGAAGLINGQAVVLSQIKGTGGQPPNGRWLASAVAGNTFNLVGYTQVAFVYGSGGFARAQTPIVTPFTRILDRRWGEKKRGRPFDQQRGRRPRRAPLVLRY